MPAILRKIFAEVAKRPTAPVLKTGGALRHRSSNLLLGVPISDDNSVKNELEDVNVSLNDFKEKIHTRIQNIDPS